MNVASTTVDRSRRVRSLVFLVTGICAVLWLIAGYVKLANEVFALDSQTLGWLVAALWLPWLLLQWSHHRLVRCGRVADRYRQAPYFVNRPGLVTRVIMHLVVNWMVLATSVGLAWLLRGTREAQSLSTLVIVACVLTWAWFNWQHHRVNRAQNLALSTTMAVALIAAAAAVFGS